MYCTHYGEETFQDSVSQRPTANSQKLIFKPYVLRPLAVDLGHPCFWSAENLLLMWVCTLFYSSPVVADCFGNDYTPILGNHH